MCYALFMRLYSPCAFYAIMQPCMKKCIIMHFCIIKCITHHGSYMGAGAGAYPRLLIIHQAEGIDVLGQGVGLDDDAQVPVHVLVPAGQGWRVGARQVDPPVVEHEVGPRLLQEVQGDLGVVLL